MPFTFIHGPMWPSAVGNLGQGLMEYERYQIEKQAAELAVQQQELEAQRAQADYEANQQASAWRLDAIQSRPEPGSPSFGQDMDESTRAMLERAQRIASGMSPQSADRYLAELEGELIERERLGAVQGLRTQIEAGMRRGAYGESQQTAGSGGGPDSGVSAQGPVEGNPALAAAQELMGLLDEAGTDPQVFEMVAQQNQELLLAVQEQQAQDELHANTQEHIRGQLAQLAQTAQSKPGGFSEEDVAQRKAYMDLIHRHLAGLVDDEAALDEGRAISMGMVRHVAQDGTPFWVPRWALEEGRGRQGAPEPEMSAVPGMDDVSVADPHGAMRGGNVEEMSPEQAFTIENIARERHGEAWDQATDEVRDEWVAETARGLGWHEGPAPQSQGRAPQGSIEALDDQAQTQAMAELFSEVHSEADLLAWFERYGLNEDLMSRELATAVHQVLSRAEEQRKEFERAMKAIRRGVKAEVEPPEPGAPYSTIEAQGGSMPPPSRQPNPFTIPDGAR